MTPFHNPQAVKDVWLRIGGDVGRLAGPANRQTRQAVLYAMTGQRIPVAKCGITVIQETAWRMLGITEAGGCTAERERIASEMIAAL